MPLAHRGLHGEQLPENSLAAFEAAAAAGYGVELDVRLSADQVPVVVHDDRLERVAGVRARVSSLTAAQLGDLHLGEGGSGPGVPTLERALAVLGDAPVMVELKQGRPRAGLLERRTAAVLDDHDGPWCVASFNPATARWFRRQRPDAVRVLTATHESQSRLPRPLARRLAELRDLPGVDPHAVSYDLHGLPNPATDRWRAQGGIVIAWTAVGADGLRRAREVADNVIFEHVRP